MAANCVQAQSIWLAPRFSAPDAMDLFQVEAPWQQASARVKVVMISIQLAESGSDVDLTRLYGDLQRRGISLAVGMLPLTRPSWKEGQVDSTACGAGVEGYSAPGQSQKVAQRLHDLGIVIDYYLMDEPLFYGHVFDHDRRNNRLLSGCHSALGDLSRDVAIKVRQVRKIFPAVQIGQVEPIMALDEQTWESDLKYWFDAYYRETGTKLDFFCVDMNWDKPFENRMTRLAELLSERQIPLQLFLNGDDTARSDLEWIGQAVGRFRYVSPAGWKADSVVIGSWAAHPSRVLPETDSDTLTSLVNRYDAWRQTPEGLAGKEYRK